MYVFDKHLKYFFKVFFKKTWANAIVTIIYYHIYTEDDNIIIETGNIYLCAEVKSVIFF